jgi:hypothetical protein
MKRSTIALAAAIAAGPALAAQDYPPGLFENSPVIPSGPGDQGPPPGPDAGPPEDPYDAGPPEAAAPMDDFCAGIASRTFRSLAEVRAAHARCDPGRRHGPRPPPDEDPYSQ